MRLPLSDQTFVEMNRNPRGDLYGLCSKVAPDWGWNCIVKIYLADLDRK
jgi:hypothetical protein